jgi:hypothetical protein
MAFNMNSTSDDDYLVTLDLLRETVEYLYRLPRHPMTAALARKVAAHLDDPCRAARAELLAAEAENRRRDGLALFGANYTPAGIPVISAQLFERELKLTSPELGDPRHGKEISRLVLDRLRSGETIALKPKQAVGAFVPTGPKVD